MPCLSQSFRSFGNHMVNVTVQDVLNATGGRLLCGDPSMQLLHITTDSRSIPEKCLFVPIVGEHQNGHDYLERALMDGCVASLTEEMEAYENYLDNHPETEKTFIFVENTTDAVQKIAKMARSHVKIPAIGITVGKTTTREMIAAALSSGLSVYKTDKNFNNWLGVPITLCDIPEDADIAVLELGLNVRGELGLISSLCDLQTAVITNIGVAHIEYYGTRDEIAKEKYTITRGFSDDRKKKMLILNADDPYVMKYKDEYGFPYLLYGTKEQADYRAANIRIENGKYGFDLYVRGRKRLTVFLSVLGEHNILNALAALAAADYYKLDLDKAAAKLAAFPGFRNRLQRIEHRGTLLIDDTYNASPSSMKAGLKVLSEIQYGTGTGRRIAVLGDMFELGENAPSFHYGVGAYASDLKINALYAVGENAVQYVNGALENGCEFECRHFEDKETLLQFLRANVRRNDIIFLKASNGMKLKEITEGLLNG